MGWLKAAARKIQHMGWWKAEARKHFDHPSLKAAARKCIYGTDSTITLNA